MPLNRKFEITDAKRGAAFTVRVVTRAVKTEFAGIHEDGTLKIRLTAPSADHPSANEELVNFLSERLGVELKKIEIVAGHDTREKLVSIEGISVEYAEQRLGAGDQPSEE